MKSFYKIVIFMNQDDIFGGLYLLYAQNNLSIRPLIEVG